ncbi:hypothetical protein J8F10_06505 [Gemmata sp. G18]|uniref:Winged helix-turn-helix domain-containing protein n=1 Tax=Gemmata palustris TaxID=2822762 RepID=A0ABS5BMJ6_9BACT|nr:hypothetical protein [Gemmata palustris]MBP3954931.1 hypothetical protein [Gemmata palustris]
MKSDTLLRIKFPSVEPACPLDWRAVMTYGVCLWHSPKTISAVAALTGFHRSRDLPALVSTLEKYNLVDSDTLRAKLPKPENGWFKYWDKTEDRFPLAYRWIGVRSRACPLTPYQNLIYWTMVSLGKQLPNYNLEGLATIMGVDTDGMSGAMQQLKAKGCLGEERFTLIPPGKLCDWWRLNPTSDLARYW